jgi:2-methylcitrate dehydratase PrpD
MENQLIKIYAPLAKSLKRRRFSMAHLGLETTAIEALSENILNTHFENLSETDVKEAKKRFIDVIGCMIAGASAPGTPELVNLVKEWGGKKEATIVVHGGKAPAYNVAMLNSVLARSYDFEALCVYFNGKVVPSHNTATTIPTVLTLGESQRINGRELITSLLVGDDIAARVLLASDWDFNLGWDGTGTVPMFGSTAIAGRLLGLNHKQLNYAFGIVLNQISGTMQSIMDGATTFKLNVATAARNGIIAAEMARAGWTGVEDALTGRFGYFKLYTHGLDHPELLTQDLGKTYYTESVFKPYPGGRPTHTPIDAALILANKYIIEPENIQEVELCLSPEASAYHYMKPFQMGDFPNGDALFSYQYSTASALVVKSVTQQNFTSESIRDTRVQALIPKIKMAKLSRDRGIELRVKMKNGQVYSQYLKEARGEPPDHRLSEEEIIDKFMTQVKFSNNIPLTRAEKILKLLSKLEELDDVSSITRLLVA